VAAAVVELDGDVARLPSAHTQLDFGSIGVGYGIDRALAVLRGRAVRRAFIDVSGDMAALGAPPGEPGWRVEIADPDRRGAGEGRAVTATRLRDAALATAANTESIVRYGSLVVGHVMDPATGWPARALRQASVLTRTAVAADALSTAMLVTGRRPEGVLRTYAV
jgi:thiamine biosynthesis lipoprotein